MKNVLLIEDSPDDIELAVLAFKRMNSDDHLVVVEDGQAALDYLFAKGEYRERKADRLPNLILMDLNLPKVGGLDVLKQMRASETTNHIPVVILSTSDEDKDIRNGYKLGANSFVRKPVDFNEFVQVMKQVQEYWLGVNTHPTPLAGPQ
ncbi:Response regulator receiver protein [Candidatus Terasakiella magnetica]|uniref:Response regulator receiver protein n=1 Tax=Candidatus Terasakiella magnetica TaxID=1867952 RepID=A0A1C3RLC2_9PROT|nr:response regulator [Candidatus Terasakiella magnetica]SCA58038.1 Response regulator receiver protein [Candidatus Terasakiella magnetica]